MVNMHHILRTMTKCYHRTGNTVGFLALHFGTQLKYKITNALVLMDSLVVYCEIINYKHDP